MTEDDDHYEALHLAPDATVEDIRASWRFLLTAFHPDRFRDPTQRDRAEEITKRVNAAWQVLGDAGLRRRYDRQREVGAIAVPVSTPPVRELPCPSCATRSQVADTGGRTAQLACPACGEAFTAMIGARWVDRPRLEKRWMGLRYEAIFADAAGERTTVTFRELPKELALPEGEVFSVVFDPRNGRPAYAIVHGDSLDVGWRVS